MNAIRMLAGYGSYAGWRVGITESGDWRFFVAATDSRTNIIIPL